MNINATSPDPSIKSLSCDYETIESLNQDSVVSTVNNDFSSISDFLFDIERKLNNKNNKVPSPVDIYLANTSLNNLLKSDDENEEFDSEDLTATSTIMNYNYKDFCGSQEWDNHIKNKQINSPYYHLISQQHSSKTHPSKQQINESSFYLSNDLNCSQMKSSQSFQQEFTSEEFTNFYHSSLISDYRLTLTDLIDLNLIDISNGLIINPLNGRRLTIADAIRIDLLNSDVKEIANTFMNNETNCIKLTVREAIKLSILNPFRNEIYLSPSNLNLKLNLNDARKRNLILKPLTLSEAFIRNLIQPNGFVRNPINNKYYSFESLVTNDLNSENQFYLFDFETKHIIDPNDSDKKLLSLAEAIEMGLILPHSFELNISHNRLNLYEAFFNSQNTNLTLLLYKPEIENVYIRLAHSVKSNKNGLAILLSRRDKIGLIEAVNLNVINLKQKTYSILNETVISLEEAAALYKTNKLTTQHIRTIHCMK